MVALLIESLVELPAAMLDAELEALELQRRRNEAHIAAIAAVTEQKMQFQADGHRSMSAYLKAHLNCSGVEAARLRRLGKLINEYPAAGATFEAGHISASNMDLIARAWAVEAGHDQIVACMPLLLDHAEQFSCRDFGIIIDRVIANADQDGNDPNDDHHANATLTAGPDGLHASITGGSALEAAEIAAVFDLAVEAEFMADVAARRCEHGDDADQHPLPRTAAQRRFAAEHAIHMAYVSTPADAQRPEPLVNIVFSAGYAADTLHQHGLATNDVFDAPAHPGEHTDARHTSSGPTASDPAEHTQAAPRADLPVDANSERTDPKDPDELINRRCETSTGIPLHPDTALRAMIHGRIRRVVLDSNSVVIDLGSARRLFTGNARQAAQLVVLSCSHPGCDIPAELCDVDHLDRHTDGGPTDQHNAGPACRSHNLFKEAARLRSRRATNGRVYLIRPDGTIILPAGARPPQWPTDTASSDEARPDTVLVDNAPPDIDPPTSGAPDECCRSNSTATTWWRQPHLTSR